MLVTEFIPTKRRLQPFNMKIVYVIKNDINDKVYVGSTINGERRWNQHLILLRNRTHFNTHLQNAFDKYGESSFSFGILEHTDNLPEREGFWIKELQATNKALGYNRCEFPGKSRLGFKATEETKLKMSIALGGVNHPMYGKKLKPETIAKRTAKQMGIQKPNSGRRKIYNVLDPDGKIVVIDGLRRFCRDNELTLSSMWNLVSGKSLKYKGFQLVT
jgi:group I intron endonuclease